MTDLFLDPKVLNYSQDKYELIYLTLRWARILKSRGTPQPMAELVDQALREITEGKVLPEQILSEKAPEKAPQEELPLAVSVAGDGVAAVLPPDDEAGDGEKKTKKKKKKSE